MLWRNIALYGLHGLGCTRRFRWRVWGSRDRFGLFESGDECQYHHSRHTECRHFPGRAFHKIDCIACIHGWSDLGGTGGGAGGALVSIGVA